MYIRGLNDNETVALTKAIVNSGTTLDLKRRPILDKHCIGGVPGNRTTMLIVPIVAAAGLTIPKTSSRSITSPAGTADSMAVLAPVCFNEAEITDIVTKANGCIVWGGGVNLAAADDKLIKIRHPLNLDPRGVLLASILAKKKAVGATHVLVDIPMGKGAKIATRDEAAILANEFMNIGSRLGMEIQCIVTPGYDPVGKAVGPGLEAREILRILNGETVSPDLLEKSLVMAGLLLEAGGAAKQGMGRQMAAEILQSGKALAKMREIISLQGGNPDVKPGDIHIGDKTYDFIAQESGRIHFINVKHISTIARAAGAPVDAGAGIYLYAEKGDKIVKGEKVFTVYSESERKLAAAQELCEKLQPVEMEKIILGGYSTETKPHVIELG
jgi:AMP phosphorylase